MIRRQALLVLALLLCLAPPALADVSVQEGEVATVTLGPGVLSTTDDNLARSGEDYDPPPGGVFLGGEVAIQTREDTVAELEESFLVTNGTETARVTIVDDDAPSLDVLDASLPEDQGLALVTVRTATPVSRPTEIGYTLAAGTAQDGADFDGRAGSVVLGSGAKETTIEVPVVRDAVDEDDEAFTVRVGAGQATVTIVNDDLRTLSVGDGRAVESDGATTILRVPVALDAPTFRRVSVQFSTMDGTARAPLDYLARLGTVTILPGQRSATIELAVLGDELKETAETIGVRLLRPSGARIARSEGTATIIDDDTQPVTDMQLSPVRLTAPRLRGSRISMRVSCPRGEERCQGRLTLYTEADRRARSRLLRAERRLGVRSFSLRGGQARALVVRIPASTAAAARANGRLRVRAWTVTRDAVGNVDTGEAGATLRVRR